MLLFIYVDQSFKCRPCNSYETNSRTDMQQHLIEHHKIDGDFGKSQFD